MNTNNQFAEALWVDLVRVKLEELSFGSIQLEVQVGRVVRIASNNDPLAAGLGEPAPSGAIESSADSSARGWA